MIQIAATLIETTNRTMKRKKSYSTTAATIGVRSRRKCNSLPINYSLYCPFGSVIRVLLLISTGIAISIDYNQNAFASAEYVYSQSAQKSTGNDLTSSSSSAHQRAYDRDMQHSFAPIPMARGHPQQQIPMTRRSNQLYDGDIRDSTMSVISRTYNPTRSRHYNNLLANHQTDPSEAIDGDDIETTQPVLEKSHLLHQSSTGDQRVDQYSAHPSQPSPIWSGASNLGEEDPSDMSSVEPQTTDALIGNQDHRRPSRHHLVEDDTSGGVDEAGPLDEEPPSSPHESSASESPSDDPAVGMARDEQQFARDKLLLTRHQSHIKAINDLFERRQLQLNSNNNVGHQQPRTTQQQQQQQRRRANNINSNQNTASSSSPATPSRDGGPLQSSQELSPISIGLDPTGSPFSPMNPFGLGAYEPIGAPPMGHPSKLAASADNIDQGLGGPSLPFGLGPLPHLLGFQSPPTFEGPQRGDQSAHSHHSAASIGSDVNETGGSGSGSAAGVSNGASPKTWPKIFRFTDGRINLSDFEKQKKIRLSNKNQHSGENHIDSSPIMFDNRPLKRKSFLILHGGIFSK